MHMKKQTGSSMSDSWHSSMRVPCIHTIDKKAASKRIHNSDIELKGVPSLVRECAPTHKRQYHSVEVTLPRHHANTNTKDDSRVHDPPAGRRSFWPTNGQLHSPSKEQGQLSSPTTAATPLNTIVHVQWGGLGVLSAVRAQGPTFGSIKPAHGRFSSSIRSP